MTRNSPFRLDHRAIGVFRILLGITILADQLIRIQDWEAFHSNRGIFSLEESQAWSNEWVWSVYWLSTGPLLPYLLEGLRFVATITLVVGLRSRLSACILFVILASVAARNPLIVHGGDKVLIVTTFFAMFLPLGRFASLEALWFGYSGKQSYHSIATTAFTLQVLLVWFMSGILKTGAEWWSEGTAISMALHMKVFATSFAGMWRGWDWLLQPLTIGIFWLECIAPWLVLVPNYWCRMAGLAALFVLEAAIWLNLEVGLFPLISIVSIVPLLPPRFMDGVSAWWNRQSNNKGTELVLFYDRDCRFCAFACRLLLSATGIQGGRLREAQADPYAREILKEHYAWSVTHDRNHGKGESQEDLQETYRHGWAAVLFVIERSPRPWLARILPELERGNETYKWIGRHRSAFGTAGRFCFGTRADPGEEGPGARCATGLALGAVLAWNIVTYPAMREWKDLRDYVSPYVGTLNLRQHWSMFAPRPERTVRWHIVAGLTRNGETRNVLWDRPLEVTEPPDGPEHYGGYRWRKAIGRALWRKKTAGVFRHFCRSGEWTALELWEFRRPNLGHRGTIDQGYKPRRRAWWRCDNADEQEVATFRAEIDRLMKEYGASQAQAGTEKRTRREGQQAE